MFSYCPKCETGKLNPAGNCDSCGYSLRVPCSECGHQNFPGARFCGACGYGMNYSVRFQSMINRNINYLQKLRLRKFATGVSFGALLAFFAFGSMGMQSGSHRNLVEKAFHQTQSFDFQADFAVNFERDIEKLCQGRDVWQNAASADLNEVVDLLIRHLKPVAEKLNRTRLPAASSDVYARSLHNFSSNADVTRGSSAMMLFHFLSDFLEFNYRDFSQESSYDDIPRFHFMSVPATALKSLGVELAKSVEEFGITEPVSLQQLCDAARTIVANAEIRASQQS